MADPRIVEYLSQNAGKYPLEALKAALVKQGFPESEVDEAARQAAGGGPPPPPSPGAPVHPADAVVFGPSRMLANGIALFKDAPAFFERIDPESGYGPAAANIALWGAVSGVLAFLIMFLKPSPYGLIAGGLQIVLLPIMAVLLSWLAAGVFHVLCLILGGQGSFRSSYQLIAAMAALFPVSTVLGQVPFGAIPIQLFGLYLSVEAAYRLHGVGKNKAWVAFGVLTAVGVVGTLVGQMGLDSLARRGLPAVPAGIGGLPVPGAAPQAIPPAAATAMGQLGSLAGQMTPEARQAMQQAMQNPGAVMQELTRYQAMAQPPQETLALLDPASQAKLSQQWPALAAPMRKSLVETLPSVPPAQRGAFMDQMGAYTKDMNGAIQQSMKLLEQAQQTMQQQGGGQR